MGIVEGVEVGLTGQGTLVPGRARVGGLDQPDVRRAAGAGGGMPAGEEHVGTGHGETHEVVACRTDQVCGALLDAEQAVVGGDVDRVVGRVDAEPVHVADLPALPAVLGGRTAPAGHQQDGCGEGSSDLEGGGEAPAWERNGHRRLQTVREATGPHPTISYAA